MGKPAIIQGDMIIGSCTGHLIPDPVTGSPIPAPPFPFSAPVTMATAPTVLIAGKPAAVIGSAGINSAVHVGLHPTDPFTAAPQRGTILGGSATVLITGKPAASSTPPPMMCITPGSIVGTGVTVLIG